MKLLSLLYKSKKSPGFNEPITLVSRIKHPLARVVFGSVPFLRTSLLSRVYCNERIVEIPFVHENITGQNLKILDFGCAESKLAIELASRGHQVHGVDLQAYPFKHRNFQFFNNDIMAIPDKEEYDAIVCVSAIEHCGLRHYGDSDADDIAIAKKFHRILKPGGTLILTVRYGRPFTNEFLRVYDETRLKQLLRGFNVSKEEYACMNERGDQWGLCSKDTAADREYREYKMGRYRGVEAIALMVLRKPRKEK